METKWTLGPLKVVEVNGNSDPQEYSPVWDVCKGNRIVAQCGKGRKGKANATLYAAAPDLVEAVKLLQAALTEHHLRDVKTRFSLCVADAVASKALAKAGVI